MNKPNKLRRKCKIKRSKLFKSFNHTLKAFPVSLSVYFSSDKLAKHG